MRSGGAEGDLRVLGLHSVFEHHEAQAPHALKAFLSASRIRFPLAVGVEGMGAIPLSMATYRMQGTPTLVLIDRAGYLRVQHFGHLPDLALGAEITALLLEGRSGGADREEESAPPLRQAPSGGA